MKDAARMQEIMARNNIPANVPFDQIASNGAHPNHGYSGGNDSNGAYSSNGQSRLSADDQREFDRYYFKWLEDMRKNDRDDIDKDVRHMQDIMGATTFPPPSPSIKSHPPLQHHADHVRGKVEVQMPAPVLCPEGVSSASDYLDFISAI
jgi:hypothetical protein